MDKEEKELLIEKWSPFLEGLPKSKAKRYKYSSVYENIVKNNNANNHKLLLSLAYQVFKGSDDIKLSTRKNKMEYIDISSYEHTDLYEHGTIMPIPAMSYNTAIASSIIGKMKTETIPKISYIKIESNKTSDLIRIYY